MIVDVLRPGGFLGDLPLFHPVTQPHLLPVSPLTAAVLASTSIALVAMIWPRARGRLADRPSGMSYSWDGRLSPLQWLTRLVAIAVLLVTIGAGRLGADDQLDNLAPALVVGLAWPLFVLASVLIGPVWRWIDPWDGLARPFTGRAAGEARAAVWPAAAAALIWVWYLSAYANPLSPRSVGTLLALYTLATVAGCLAVGRARWLAAAEPFGNLLSWMALLPRRRLGAWEPPRGAVALLGIVAGGVLFGAVRRSRLWGDLNTRQDAELVAAFGLVAFSVATAALLALASALTRHGRAAVAHAAVPAVAAVIVAVAMERNRLSTSLQLLPGLLGDPFGQGWDLLGRADSTLDPDPLGTRGVIWAQLAVVTAGHIVAAVVLARRVPRRSRRPAAIAFATLLGTCVVALASH